MNKLLYGFALLPFFSAAALAQPAQLDERQMDSATAGWSLFEIDYSNTSATAISIYGASLYCPSCYLSINSNAVSIVSTFGPVLLLAPPPP